VCELLEVSRDGVRGAPSHSGADAAAGQRESPEAVALRDRIAEICLEFPRYGYPRVTARLRRESIVVNHKRTLRIMREESLLCAAKRAFVGATDSRHGGYRRYPI
jgi:hypothetical protein